MRDKHEDSLMRFYESDPVALRRAHDAFLSDISPDAKHYLDKNDLHHLAHAPEMEAIRTMPESEHLAAVKRLRESELSGPKTDNDETKEYLGERNQRMSGHTRRTGLVR